MNLIQRSVNLQPLLLSLFQKCHNVPEIGVSFLSRCGPCGSLRQRNAGAFTSPNHRLSYRAEVRCPCNYNPCKHGSTFRVSAFGYYSTGNGNHGREVKPPKIYTRTGDKGTSVTIAGDRRAKDDVVFEAVGTTDELSSTIGLAREFVRESSLQCCDKQLEQIQCVLQDAGSNIATPRSLASPNQIKITEFDGSTVEMLEEWIDDMTSTLPPLRNFILPSGGKASCALHVARSVCRRAERSIAPLARRGEIDPAVARFINRLSDYLFTAARFAAQDDGREETIYRRVKPQNKER